MAKNFFLRMLAGIGAGSLEVECEGGEIQQFGDPRAELRARLVVHHPRFYRRALLGGDVGVGEAYMNGDWSTPDLVSLIRVAVRNLALYEEKSSFLSSLSRFVDTFRHRRKSNTIDNSRRNIGAHYDLSNDFFRLFLDRSRMYSCAWYQTAKNTLETAQTQKLDRICRKLELSPSDHVLEIGTGWGAFALHAARNYGCRVTTTTISRQQFDYARAAFDTSECGERIELLCEDYRNLRGEYEKIVSIEMFEAVGLEYYDTFFSACDRLLKRDGSMLLQTIVMNDQKFPAYRRHADWIQTYIFPGSELASVNEILSSLARSTRMSLFHAEDLGVHYARTLAEWRARFNAKLTEVRALGFDDRFICMWDYYLAYCEGAFLERHVSDFQLMLTKTHNQRALMGEPWRGDREQSAIRATA
ncbi:MAG TPA: cyclopropane-fatty-acyl-phospholipid synthase family protein [Bryobacteraceae bacterium]|nr:cyclopropane-fatty-acyl-phospholipid synthase family protein [Bryobacteraceae bacterium]